MPVELIVGKWQDCDQNVTLRSLKIKFKKQKMCLLHVPLRIVHSYWDVKYNTCSYISILTPQIFECTYSNEILVVWKRYKAPCYLEICILHVTSTNIRIQINSNPECWFLPFGITFNSKPNYFLCLLYSLGWFTIRYTVDNKYICSNNSENSLKFCIFPGHPHM